MRRTFQILLTISMVVIFQIGFWIFTFLAKNYINDEIVQQAKNDNQVIGEQLITLLHQTGLTQNNPETDSTLQHICDVIKLPNGGFICAIDTVGNLVAGPGLKPGMSMPFPPILNGFGDDDKSRKPVELGVDEVFSGYANFIQEGRRDVVSSLPISNDLRLFVHQNSEIIAQRANQYVKPLLFLGLIITFFAGLFTFITTNKIVNSYESKIEVQNGELKDALAEIKEKQIEIIAQNEELGRRGKILQEQHNEITSSIQYAKRIQSATLPEMKIDSSIISDHFLLFLPRDIVSGDFYWHHDFGDLLVITAVDCTGHGVPGAFMSMIGTAFLNEIVIEKGIRDAGQILSKMRNKVISALGQESMVKGASDGMDMALCVIEKETRKLQFAGAFNPMFCIRNGEIIEYKGDRMPVGIYSKTNEFFTNQTLKLKKDDVVYLFSDGYADQFGGGNNRKFLTKNFKSLLLEINMISMEDQKTVLLETLKNWQGKRSQVDDILVIGLRIN